MQKKIPRLEYRRSIQKILFLTLVISLIFINFSNLIFADETEEDIELDQNYELIKKIIPQNINKISKIEPKITEVIINFEQITQGWAVT